MDKTSQPEKKQKKSGTTKAGREPEEWESEVWWFSRKQRKTEEKTTARSQSNQPIPTETAYNKKANVAKPGAHQGGGCLEKKSSDFKTMTGFERGFGCQIESQSKGKKVGWESKGGANLGRHVVAGYDLSRWTRSTFHKSPGGRNAKSGRDCKTSRANCSPTSKWAGAGRAPKKEQIKGLLDQ